MTLKRKKPTDPILLDVDGLSVWLTFKQVKNVNMRIVGPSGEIRVSAPRSCSQREVERIIRSKRAELERKRKEFLATTRMRAEGASPEEQEAWKGVVSACVPPLVEQWAKILDVKPGRLVFRNMKSRWGSCQPGTGRICINTRLALFPPECLEYVVVHELCHLLVPNHGPRFRALMTHVMPDWERRRDRLEL